MALGNKHCESSEKWSGNESFEDGDVSGGV